MATWRSAEERLAELERKRARLAAQRRAALTREKIVLGAAIAAEMKENAAFSAQVIAILRTRVKRDSDLRAIGEILGSAPDKVTLPDAAPTPEAPLPAPTSISPDPFSDLDAARRRSNRHS